MVDEPTAKGTYEQVMEHHSAVRERFWNGAGRMSQQAFFGPTNGHMSPWPGKAENLVPVDLEQTLVLTTDGLSSPWGEDGADSATYDDWGEELELYIETPVLKGQQMPQMAGHFLLKTLARVANHIVGQDYRFVLDMTDSRSMVLPDIAAPADWLRSDGTLGLVVGITPGWRPRHIPSDDNPEAVLLAAITPVRPDEFEWALEGPGSREELSARLADSPWGHAWVPDRQPVV